MKTLRTQLEVLRDLRAKRETTIYRYYNIENHASVLELITEEIISWDASNEIKKEVYVKLLNPDILFSKNIVEVCKLFKIVIIEKYKGLCTFSE